MLTSSRANTVLLVLILAVGIGIVAMLASGVRGGPLDPPGPPASTDSVKLPGTPISSLPFAIDQPGYYYVTRNLAGVGTASGITISVSNVTVDLGGFTLTGPGAGPGSGDGVSNVGARNIVVRNGSVRGWYVGVNLSGQFARVERIQALSNWYGLFISGGHSVVTDCNASLNVDTGIIVNYGTVRNCTAAENQVGIKAQGYSLVEGNRVNSSTGVGIDVTGSSNTFRDNEARQNLIDFQLAGLNQVLVGNVFCESSIFATNTQILENVITC